VLFLVFINDIGREVEGNRPDEVRVSHREFMHEGAVKIVEWAVK